MNQPIQIGSTEPVADPTPDDPTGINATHTTLCVGGSTELTAEGAQGTVYWYTGSCGGTQVGTGNPITFSPSDTTTYFARNFNNDQFSTGCASISINVSAQPTAPGLTKNPNAASVCAGQNLTVSTTSGSGGTGTVTDQYRYSTDNGGTWSNWSASVPSFAAVEGTNTIQSRRTATGSGCNESSYNEVSWSVYQVFTAGAIATTGETICYNTQSSEIGSETAASGGDGSITYSWRSSTDGFTNSTLIDGETNATYTPGTLTQTTTFRRYAKDGTCIAEPVESTGEWTVTVREELAVTDPLGKTVNACDFSEESQLRSDFDDWVNAATIDLNTSIIGAVSPTVTDNRADFDVDAFYCDGGVFTVTWEVEDECGIVGANATYSVNAPPVVIYNQPEDETKSACEFANQDAVGAAFNNWVDAQTLAINIGGGCDPDINNNSGDQTIAVLCEGGFAVVTWTITDLCETVIVSATWTLTKPDAVTYNQPEDETKSACDFADQGVVDQAFNDWVSAQNTAINHGGDCNPEINNNSGDQTIPVLCEGGFAVVTWTITDLCETVIVSATWTLTKPDAVTYSQPEDETKSACDYTNQGEVDAAFDSWVTAQTAAIGIGGGCNPEINNNSGDQTIPVLCDGGFAVVTWTITDLCETIIVSATWTLTPTPAVSYNDPEDETKSACDYTNQGEVDAAFAAWVLAETSRIDEGGGCNPEINNNSGDQTIPVLCDGGFAIVTWTITDLCETIIVSATWTLTPTPAVSYNEPEDDTRGACEFADQTAVNQAFTDWVAAETTRIALDDGCDPEINNNSGDQTIPVLCEGGFTVVTWTIEDLCETITVSATWTLTKPDAVTYNQPEDETKSACDYTNQGEVDQAFSDWVSAQTAAIGIGGGCDPEINNNSGNQTIPVLCEGGFAVVTWTITDLCETIIVSATWTLTPAPAVSYNKPEDDTQGACEFADQTAVNQAFTDWVAAETTRIALDDGCDPEINNNSGDQTIPVLCEGGFAVVTWTIEDLCETITVSATWTLTPTPAVSYNDPEDETKSACDYTNQGEVDAAFAAWVLAETSRIDEGGGCNPEINNNSGDQTIPVLCEGGFAVVTWTITDLCETIIVSATWTLDKPDEISYDIPQDIEADPTTYFDQTALNTAFDQWLNVISTSISGGCPQLEVSHDFNGNYPEYDNKSSVTVEWTVTDLCYTATHEATFSVAALPFPWQNCNTHTMANGDASYAPKVNNGTFHLTATGQSSLTNDVFHYVYQEVSGNQLTVIARVDNVQNGGWAGVMMRESCDPASKTFFFKTQLYSAMARVGFRQIDNRAVRMVNVVASNVRWMKLQRNGNQFRLYTSGNGVSWQLRYRVNIAMGNTIQAGIFTESMRANRTSLAWFDNVEVATFLKAGDNFAAVEIMDNDYTDRAIDLYPNPSSDQITITIEGNESRVNYTIVDMEGRLMQHSEFSGAEFRLDVSNFKPGLYMIRFEIEGEVLVRRIVVM